MATTGSNPDVVIVGGGFAGVTAARELTMRGRSAVLVQARDWLGGRTYASDHDGHAMEATVLPDLRTSEGRLFFAGGDSAIAWRSSIDWAIEGWLPRRPRHRRLPDRRSAPDSTRRRTRATGWRLTSSWRRALAHRNRH